MDPQLEESGGVEYTKGGVKGEVEREQFNVVIKFLITP